VNESIKHSEECGVATRSKLDTPPNGGWHDAVMNNMKIGDLIEFLP
jgi:hypothetical protein